MGRCLETMPNFVSAVVRDNKAQGVTLRSPEAWKEQVKSPSTSTQRVDVNGVVAQ